MGIPNNFLQRGTSTSPCLNEGIYTYKCIQEFLASYCTNSEINEILKFGNKSLS